MLTVEKEAQCQSQHQHNFPTRQLHTQLIQFFSMNSVTDVVVALVKERSVAWCTFKRC